jgi:AcrR family transcriptional regulator
VKGRRTRDAVATRAAILAAAKRRFSRDSYERVGLRQIAADVGVDAALVTRYFGSKEGLFKETLSSALEPTWLLSVDKAAFGDRVFAGFDESRPAQDLQTQGEELDYFMLLFHASSVEPTRSVLAQLIEERLMLPLARWLGGEDALLRAKLIATLLTGVSVQLLTAGASPLGAADWRRFRGAMARAVQALVDGPGPVELTLSPRDGDPTGSDNPLPAFERSPTRAAT